MRDGVPGRHMKCKKDGRGADGEMYGRSIGYGRCEKAIVCGGVGRQGARHRLLVDEVSVRHKQLLSGDGEGRKARTNVARMSATRKVVGHQVVLVR